MGRQSEYSGAMTVPGEQETRPVSIVYDRDGSRAAVRFEEPVAGAAEWQASQLSVVQRLKYEEVIFITTGLPREGVDLVWKINADYEDGTAAAVVVARPNEHRVSGEKGFVLTAQRSC